jgi:ATP-dependent Zn protease
MTRAEQFLLTMAKHESGHCAFALLLDVEFDAVTIVPHQLENKNNLPAWMGTTAGGGLLNLNGYIRPNEWVQLNMAGLAGERINRQEPGGFENGDIFSSATNDWKSAMNELRKLGIPKGQMDREVNLMLSSAWYALQRYREVHTAIVEGLLAKETLSFKECMAIFKRYE